MVMPRTLLTLALAGWLTAGQPALAQEGTIKIMLGFPAGASSDTLTRLLADRMRESLGQPVIVENKVGAGGRIAAEALKGAAPDGRTLLMSPVAAISIFPHSFGNLRYDPFTDFAPVAHLSNFQIGLGVSTQLPVTSLAEYVALVKKDSKAGFYASAAAGSLPHFFGVMFARAAGITMTHVPYKGTANAMTALAAGEIAAATTLVADLKTVEKSGKARVLAASGSKRPAAFPDVPTFKELGYDIEGYGWYGLWAPAATPAPTIARLAKAAATAIHSAGLQQRLEIMGLEPTGYGPEELGRIQKADYEKWGPIIKASGFKPGQ
ncbi:MAG: tripartite tricarboxylate transporter substrate-binding protein [Betaproteobacteria bacterium]|nr:tripartite tricarboxylate transporter substrate-binding protein [Betaproteobacteria bacterium]